MHFHITTAIIIILQHINRIFTQGIPISPCPKVFQYRFDGTDWFGLLSVRNPNPSVALQIKVTLSMRGKPTTNYLGEIELLSRGQIQIDAPVVYKIKFPKTHFPPKLLQVTANNGIICVGQADQGIFLTQIQLEHTRKFTFIDDDEPSGILPEHTSFPATLKAGGEDVGETDFSSSIDTKFTAVQMPVRKVEIKHKPQALQDICGKIDKHLRSRKSSSQLTASVPTNAKASELHSREHTADGKIHIFASSAGDTRTKINDSDSQRTASPPPLTFIDKQSVLLSNTQNSTHFIDLKNSANSLPVSTLTRGSWPWLAAIYVNNMTSLAYQCAGTLVSTRVIISSAHCFHMHKQHYTANDVLAFLGRHNLRNWNEEHSVAAPVNDIFIHPDYDALLGTYDADIAIVVLKHQIRFNSYIRPACLWSGDTQLEYVVGERGFIVGWDLSHANSQSFMAAHRFTTAAGPRLINAPIVSNEVCFAANPQLHSLTSNRTFCAGMMLSANPPRDRLTLKSTGKTMLNGPCTGNSGAGLLLLRNKQWILRGTLSATLPSKQKKCISNQYVIYADVAKFLDWIIAFII
ncbi:serine protease gd [Eurosta solidaginis]|uniref:serine protease gd n=1 Tax=Eurosta solidaginis TaxID=178769 RepID=UPI0035311A0A